jgi:hypothetical protein
MVIELTHKQCIDMELYLNLTKESNTYLELGNKLYSAGLNKIEIQEITMNEYDWLQDTIIKIL